jgi:hypothetical protein
MLNDQLVTFISHYFTSLAAWMGEKTYDVTENKCNRMLMYIGMTAESMITS